MIASAGGWFQMNSKEPVFVVGVFRSGTSLLCTILNQNPEVALMFECDVWNFPGPLLNLRFKRNWAERIEFYNRALSRHRMVSVDDLLRLEKIRTTHDLYHAYGEMKGAVACGEKSPFYCDRLVQLYNHYPGASFIMLWRDPVEIYRSVLHAGRTSRFFGRPGMLSRLIYYQEEAVCQSALIETKGARVFRVDYREIVDHTEKVCRDISAFLKVPYDARMLQLGAADLSALDEVPQHIHLRRGVIERQRYDHELVRPAMRRKLERYRCRWERLRAGSVKSSFRDNGREPGAVELVFHDFMGRALISYDSLVRVGFEFLPLTWLRTYRLLKHWIVNPPSGDLDEKTSIVRDLKTHWFTVLTATVMLGAIVLIHVHSNPHLMFILFYGIPCAFLALVVNTRWATLFVLASSIIAPMVQYDGDPDYRFVSVFAWNCITRFILLEILIMTLGRIRLEFSQSDHRVKQRAARSDG